MPTAPFIYREPGQINQAIGTDTRRRIEQRNEILTKYELAGGIPPATILNMGPKELKIRPGFINYAIPKCPDGKSFSVYTVDTILTCHKFKGQQELGNGDTSNMWETKETLPAEQLLEFLATYNLTTTQGAELGGDDYMPQGGIVVFEGTASALKSKEREVRVPSYTQRGIKRYVTSEFRNLDEMIRDANETLRLFTLAIVRQGDNYADGNVEEKKNMDARIHFVYHDFAVNKKWLSKARAWRHHEAGPGERCKSCNEQYVSQTGQCKCGWVQEPLKAYMNAAIPYDHARMDSLTSEEWKTAKVEQNRRTAARA